MNRHLYRRDRAAFTLVELLAVIAITVLLVALLAPLVKGALEKGRTARCFSNIRQIGIAFTLYMSEQGGAYPVAAYNDFRGGAQGLMRFLAPYLRHGTVRDAAGHPTEWVSSENTCPSYRLKNLAYSRTDPAYGSYAYHHAFNGQWNNDPDTPAVPFPSCATLGGRQPSELAGNRTAGAHSITHWRPSQYGAIWDTGWTDPTLRTTPHNYYGIPGHHPTYHVLFADLHAAPHPWVHRNGTIPNGASPNVPPELREDQYRIVE
ncbi:MAG TPA: prepilin-type N-terminal cleavage/methylation domain-containing protein [Kiritimatiellia bacterium]|nr:prepilin-type N-terminal cleavage/methylation domain-containing protein [Kiritimatiellia bacterium]